MPSAGPQFGTGSSGFNLIAVPVKASIACRGQAGGGKNRLSPYPQRVQQPQSAYKKSVPHPRARWTRTKSPRVTRSPRGQYVIVNPAENG